MNELALFSGACGGVLGGRLIGFRNVGYVESNDYRQRIIQQRIADGLLERAPVFGCIRAFLREGYAASYSELVDVITAGFPCQAFSQAAAGRNDPTKNLWPETAEVIRLVRPRYVLLENSPRIVTSGYIGTVLRDLAVCGINATWDVFSAAEEGADHIRQRWWLVGYSDCDSESTITKHDETSGLPAIIAHAAGRSSNGAMWTNRSAEAMEGRRGPWAIQPGMDRVAHGVPDWMDRLAALGDAQVPAVVVRAWRELTD